MTALWAQGQLSKRTNRTRPVVCKGFVGSGLPNLIDYLAKGKTVRPKACGFVGGFCVLKESAGLLGFSLGKCLAHFFQRKSSFVVEIW